MSAIILGVISGLVTTIIVWVVSKLYKNSFIPWYRKQVYSGIELTGSWQQEKIGKSSNEDEQTVIYTLEIDEQCGHDVKGTFSHDYRSESRKSNGKYNCKGQIIDGNLVLSLSPVDKSLSSFGAILMNIVGSGGSLEGKYTYKGAVSNTIIADDLELQKK